MKTLKNNLQKLQPGSKQSPQSGTKFESSQQYADLKKKYKIIPCFG